MGSLRRLHVRNLDDFAILGHLATLESNEQKADAIAFTSPERIGTLRPDQSLAPARFVVSGWYVWVGRLRVQV
jgi:hypothetical protein